MVGRMTEKLTVSEEQLTDLRAKHGRVIVAHTPAGDIVFRAPTVAEEQAFQASYYGSSQHAGLAYRNLMVTLVVSPEPLAFQAVIKDWPALNMNRNVLAALKVVRGEVNEEEVK